MLEGPLSNSDDGDKRDKEVSKLRNCFVRPLAITVGSLFNLFPNNLNQKLNPQG